MSVVEVEARQRILYVRLNRPEAKNAINKEVHLALCDAWERLKTDDSLDLAVVTGTGDAFCAGMDLKAFVPEFVGAGPQKLMDWAELGLGGLTRGYHHLDKPVIAINTATYWWSLRQAGIEDKVPGWGSLLLEH